MKRERRSGGNHALRRWGSEHFNVLLATMGGTVLLFGLVSGWLKRLSLNESLLALGVGVLFGPLLGFIQLEQWGHTEHLLEEVARLTLALGLMRVALRLPRGYPAKAWRSLSVLLTLGMLAMWLAGSALVHVLLGLSWWESLLIGAILTPTDPVVAASLTTGEVAEKNLPEDTRHLLSTESGANDGLAYPFVMLPVLVLTRPEGEVLPHFLTTTLLREVGGAVALGAFLGWGLSRLLLAAEKREPRRRSLSLACPLPRGALAEASGGRDARTSPLAARPHLLKRGLRRDT